jgi:hypothetical protein
MTMDWPRSPTVIGLWERTALIAWATAGAGCSTALSTMQSAETLPARKWHVGVGMDVAVPVSRIADALQAAYHVEEKVRAEGTNYTPTDEDRREYTDAIIGLALSAPGTGVDVMVRRGLGAQVDVGARYTTTGLHADVKWQFLGSNRVDAAADGWNGALSVGYGYHSFDGLLFDVLELVQVDDFSRHDLEVPLIFGRRFGRFGRTWFGPKLIAAKVHVDAQLQRLDATLDTDAWITYVGGFAGIAGGYRGFEAFVELTVMDLRAKPTILGEKRDLGGIVVMPAAGVVARF